MELQLIRSSLATKTDEELAELLERPVEEVRDKINELTDGAGDERSRDVSIWKQEQAKEKQKRSRKKEPNPDAIARETRIQNKKKEQKKAHDQWEKQTTANKFRDDRRHYKTLPVDLKQMISVKLDDKTYAFIKPQKTKELTDALIKQTIDTYQQQKMSKNIIFQDDSNSQL